MEGLVMYIILDLSYTKEKNLSTKINHHVLETFAEFSPVDIMSETFGVIMIDLLKCSSRNYGQEDDIYIPAPEGVYLPSSIEPILNFQMEHYYSYQAQLLKIKHGDTLPVLPDIRNYNDFMKANGPIYNSYGKQVYVAIPATKNGTSPAPLFNYGAVHAAFIAIWDHFNTLSRASKPTTNVHEQWLHYANYVKPEFLKKPLYLFDVSNNHNVVAQFGRYDQQQIANYTAPQTYKYYEEGEHSWNPWSNPGLRVIYEDLIDPFVGREFHRMYRLILQGSTLYIEKGHDIRVIEFQRMIWDHMESIRHETENGFYRP